MGQTARAAALVALRRRPPRLASRRARTSTAAIPLAAVAMAAQHDLHTAARAQEQAGGMVDGQAPRDDSRGTPMASAMRCVQPHAAAYTELASRYLARL